MAPASVWARGSQWSGGAGGDDDPAGAIAFLQWPLCSGCSPACVRSQGRVSSAAAGSGYSSAGAAWGAPPCRRLGDGCGGDGWLGEWWGGHRQARGGEGRGADSVMLAEDLSLLVGRWGGDNRDTPPTAVPAGCPPWGAVLPIRRLCIPGSRSIAMVASPSQLQEKEEGRWDECRCAWTR